MYIEVVTIPESPAKDKGNLLEELAGELLQTQGFEIEKEVRKTASELDLLCKHKVNRKKIYVECKAHRDALSATTLIKLLGNIDYHHYQEGWLISTGPLGKDAKGFKDDWEDRPTDEAQKLSIYTPERE